MINKFQRTVRSI